MRAWWNISKNTTAVIKLDRNHLKLPFVPVLIRILTAHFATFYRTYMYHLGVISHFCGSAGLYFVLTRVSFAVIFTIHNRHTKSTTAVAAAAIQLNQRCDKKKGYTHSLSIALTNKCGKYCRTQVLMGLKMRLRIQNVLYAHKMMSTRTQHFGWSQVLFVWMWNGRKRYVFIMLIVDSFWACARTQPLTARVRSPRYRGNYCDSSNYCCRRRHALFGVNIDAAVTMRNIHIYRYNTYFCYHSCFWPAVNEQASTSVCVRVRTHMNYSFLLMALFCLFFDD